MYKKLKLILATVLLLPSATIYAQRDLDDEDPVFLRAYKQYEEQKYKEAYETYTQYLRQKNTQVGFYNRALCSYAMGDYKDAISDYTKAISYGRKMYDVYYGRGLCYFLQANYERGVTDFDSSLYFKDNYGDTYTYKGACKFYLKKYAEALELENKSVLLKSDYEPPYYYRAMIKY